MQSWTGALVSPSFEVEPDNPYTQLRSDLAVFTLCPAPFSVFSPSLSVLDVKKLTGERVVCGGGWGRVGEQG